MADAVFLALSVITIGSAIAALELRSLIYGAIALMGSLGGVAGLFLLLDAPFVAMFQIATKGASKSNKSPATPPRDPINAIAP